MPFLQPSAIVETVDGRHIKVWRPIQDQSPSTGTVTTIEAGFESDGGSTPKLVWSLGFTPFGLEWLAYILHDWLYRRTFLPREFCDKMLLEAMEAQGVLEAKRLAIYEAVRVGGQAAFDDDRAALSGVG